MSVVSKVGAVVRAVVVEVVEVRSKVKASATIAASLAIKPKTAESRRSRDSSSRNLEVGRPLETAAAKEIEAKLKRENATNVKRRGTSQKIARARILVVRM